MEKRTLVHVCLCSFSILGEETPLKNRGHCFKINLWISSGLSEVLALTFRENMCD